MLVGALEPLGLRSSTGRIISDIRANLGALDGLFNGLLDIARIDAGTVTVTRQSVDVDEIFDRLDHFLRPTSGDLDLDLRFRSDGTQLFTDPVLIEQIMLNLGTNALRNTARGGVLIGARKRSNCVRLEVWDTGSGIAAADQKRIFDEFVQVGNPERNRRKGMGLGLAIASRTARLLGTEIGLASVPGRGSFFWVTQPIATTPRKPVELRTPLPESGATPGGRLLFIDDDPAVREALSVLFEERGLGGTIVGTVAEARLAMQSTTFSMVFSDYRLPGAENGLEFLLQLQGEGRFAATRPFLVTGDMNTDLLSRAARANIVLLHKPLSPQNLMRLIAGEEA